MSNVYYAHENKYPHYKKLTWLFWIILIFSYFKLGKAQNQETVKVWWPPYCFLNNPMAVKEN